MPAISSHTLSGTRVALVTVAALMFAPMATTTAQRVDPAESGVPVATSRIVKAPDQYYDRLVTVSAGVEHLLSKTAFVVDQRRAAGASTTEAVGMPVLVVAPYLDAPLGQRSYVVVRGHVTKFEPASIARLVPEYTLDLTPDVASRYAGQPVIVATSVRDATFTELAAKPAPPASAADTALAAAMKVIGPAAAGLRNAVRESEADLVAANVAKLIPAFMDTETVWANLGQKRAVEWTGDARGRLLAMERDADADDWEAVRGSLGKLNELCQTCHTAYREQLENGTYRIKPGSI